MRKRAFIGLVLGVVISSACLWYALKDVNLSAMIETMVRVDARWVLASVGLGLMSLVVRAIRWRLLLGTIRPVEIRPLLSATFVGMMANNLLPARLGEVVRAWVLSRREQLPVATSLASIVIERLLDVVAALAILGVCLVGLPELGGGISRLLKRTGIVILMLVAVGIAGLWLVFRFREAFSRASERFSLPHERAWLSHGLRLLIRFIDGLCVFRDLRHVVMLAGLSLIIWGIAVASFHVLAEGFGLGLRPIQTALVFVIVLFGVAVPSAPGFVGTFHGFCVAGLGMVAEIEPTEAAAYATLLHGSQWIATNAVGLGFLVGDRALSWAAVVGVTRHS